MVTPGSAESKIEDVLGSYEPKEVQTFRAAIEKFKLWNEPKDRLGWGHSSIVYIYSTLGASFLSNSAKLS
jgi:hypothetical protein